MRLFDIKKYISVSLLGAGMFAMLVFGQRTHRVETSSANAVYAQVQTLTSVDIATDADLGNIAGPVYLSALAKDEFGNPIYNGVVYEWTTSSTNSIGTIDDNGAIATFHPQHLGTGYLIVIARIDGSFVDTSRLLEVTGGVPVCNADFNGDKLVDLSDYSILVNSFLTTNPTADANNDGIVDLSDYSILVSEFLQVCQ